MRRVSDGGCEMKLLLGLVGAVAITTFLIAGCAPDNPTITSVSWPDTVHSGTEFAVTALANDAGQNNYDVEWVAQGSGPQIVDMICNGTQHGLPSADGSACEYDSDTTTTTTTTTTVALFTWTAPPGTQYTMEFCAASSSSSAKNCVTKVLTVS